MNIWWFLLPLLGASWAIPMIGLRHAGNTPPWLFWAIAALWIVAAILADPLYDWGIRARRKLGMRRLADWGERMKPKLLPPARLTLGIMAVITALTALL